MPSLPTGTVTFLFTDIEGSTTLLQRLGDRRYAEVLAEQQRLLRDAFAKGGGQEIDTQGDAFLVAFSRARDAVGAAVAAQRVLANHSWPDCASLRVRMGLHTGEPISETRGYIGLDVHRAARICAAGHGGQILLSDAVSSLATRDLPSGVSLRDLGTHRLKDLTEPEHLFQVVHPDLPADFPALKSIAARSSNLPIQLTSFIGREREIAAVKQALSTARVVTLTGAGGSGKTRLALRVAADLLDTFPDGVWFVELGPLSDPSLVPKAVASALDVPEQPGREIPETLASALCPKHVLLVLDNCEHLLSASQDLAEDLLRVCPKLRILATSRETLRLDGELTYPVPSLQLPDLRRLPPLAQLVEIEAVRLFAERAAFSQPHFTLTASNAPIVTQICHRLDGIPLAIEFAAARVKVLSVDQIAARLDDRFRLLTTSTRKTLPRHQTLRAALDWSYDLLSEQERTALRRLSVFAGGWTLEAAEAVCSSQGVETTAVFELLTQLVDKSLIVVDTYDGEARYRLLETVRQYSLSRLLESGEADDVRRRHRDWYITLGEQAWPEYFGPRATLWLQRLESEHDNLRAAVEWSKVDKDGAEAELRLVGTLWWFLVRHGDWSEAREWLEGALARSAEAPPTALPWALAGASNLAFRRGDYELAMKLGAEGLSLSRELGDKEASAVFLYTLGSVAERRRDPEHANALLTESLNVSRELGNQWLCGNALNGLGHVAQWLQGSPERAIELHTESLAEFREAGDVWGIALTLRSMGMAAHDLNDCGRAANCFRESLAISSEAGDRWLPAECLEGLARVASAEGYHERAARLFGMAEVLHETLGWRPSPLDQAHHDRYATSTRANLGEATFARVCAEGRAMTLEQAIEYALQERTLAEETSNSPSNVAPD